MKTKQLVKIIAVTTIIIVFTACNKYNSDYQYFEIRTDLGKIVVRLYNSTPMHRDNFSNLVDEKFYDSLIFHRVIKDFVIQGGDPNTKGKLADSLIGLNDSGYLVDAELSDTIYHKRGALGMAREGDDTNPYKKSSGSQFYIVVGKVFSDSELNNLEKKIQNNERTKLLNEIKRLKISEVSLKSNKIDTNQLNLLVNYSLDSIINQRGKFEFSENQRKIYTTIGGIPHLDRNYTVFGEVIEGMDIVEKISLVETNISDVPIYPIRMFIKKVK